MRIKIETILKPGEQAIVNDRSNRIDVKDFSSEEILAWKNGYFTFNNADIKSVMKTIARWYDIEVTYTGAVGNVYFEGTISRFDSIEKLLKTISLTGSVKFKIVGRRVIVMA
jgi:transmembrane sensor